MCGWVNVGGDLVPSWAGLGLAKLRYQRKATVKRYRLIPISVLVAGAAIPVLTAEMALLSDIVTVKRGFACIADAHARQTLRLKTQFAGNAGRNIQHAIILERSAVVYSDQNGALVVQVGDVRIRRHW